MERTAAIVQIREAAKHIVLQLMKIHPALPALNDAETMGECIKSLHETRAPATVWRCSSRTARAR